ncbi:cytochrome P450 2F2-like [Gastrophryne carolinensis]
MMAGGNMDWYGILLVCFTVCVSYIVLAFIRIAKEKAMLPPGPFPLPFIGNLLQINTKDLSGSLIKLKDKYGPVYTLYLGSKPGIVLCGYDAVKEALIDQSEVFGDRGDFPVFMNFIGGHDIGFTSGEKSTTRRRFAVLTLRNFGMGKRSVEEQILEEARFLKQEFEKTKGSPVTLRPYFARAICNVICSAIYGSRFHYEDKRLQIITDSINKIFCIMSSPWGNLYNIFPSLMDCIPGPHKDIGKNFQNIYDITNDSYKYHEKTLDPENPRDYIDCFLIKMRKEKDNPDSAFYYDSLSRTIQDLLFGGIETISINLTYAFLVLLKYPEVAEKMQEEIDHVIGRDRLPSYVDRNKMPYTEAAINELMRFCDIFPVSLPHCTSKDTMFRGYFIPKGTYVTPLLASVHYDPDCYAEPNKFNPNNFLDENGRLKKNNALMAFSAGKRKCPGEIMARMELFLFYSSLLQKFNFKPVIPREEIDLSPLGSGLGKVPRDYKCCIVPRCSEVAIT